MARGLLPRELVDGLVVTKTVQWVAGSRATADRSAVRFRGGGDQAMTIVNNYDRWLYRDCVKQ